jgi:hypothetical protein
MQHLVVAIGAVENGPWFDLVNDRPRPGATRCNNYVVGHFLTSSSPLRFLRRHFACGHYSVELDKVIIAKQ